MYMQKLNNKIDHKVSIKETSENFISKLNCKTILIVDDDNTLTQVAKYVLEKYGFTVTVAANGEEALSFFCDKTPSAILLDLAMPEVDGFELCQLIRISEKGDKVPIVIMTGHTEKEYVNKAYNSGATDFISKPVNWNVLMNRLEIIWKAVETDRLLIENKNLQSCILNNIAD